MSPPPPRTSNCVALWEGVGLYESLPLATLTDLLNPWWETGLDGPFPHSWPDVDRLNLVYTCPQPWCQSALCSEGSSQCCPSSRCLRGLAFSPPLFRRAPWVPSTSRLMFLGRSSELPILSLTSSWASALSLNVLLFNAYSSNEFSQISLQKSVQ